MTETKSNNNSFESDSTVIQPFFTPIPNLLFETQPTLALVWRVSETTTYNDDDSLHPNDFEELFMLGNALCEALTYIMMSL